MVVVVSRVVLALLGGWWARWAAGGHGGVTL
jgi:hypothetical protein